MTPAYRAEQLSRICDQLRVRSDVLAASHDREWDNIFAVIVKVNPGTAELAKSDYLPGSLINGYLVVEPEDLNFSVGEPLQEETAERRQITGASFFFGCDFLCQS